MDNFKDNQRCFVCGTKNALGLQLKFKMDAERLQAESQVNFPHHFQGWANVIHGGLISTVLDEAMVKAAAASHINCVTAEMTIKFKKPVLPDTAYEVQGRIVARKKPILLAEGSLRDKNQTLLASASAKLFVI
jgi:uncharacterized protein (TIGR00369 family)